MSDIHSKIPIRAYEHSNVDGGIPSAQMRQCIEMIIKEDNTGALYYIFTQLWPQGVYQHGMADTPDMDLYHWLPVLHRFFDIFYAKNIKDIPLTLIKVMLDYLGYIMYQGKNKGCMFFTEKIGNYLISEDVSVSESAAYLLYAYCCPSPSAPSHAEIEAKDSHESKKYLLLNNRVTDENEITLEVAENALIIFDSLGLLTSDYGMLEYLRGTMLVEMSNSLTVNFPGSGIEGYEAMSFTIPLDEPDISVESLCDIETTNEHITTSLRFLLHAIRGLQGSIDQRLSVIHLRLLCLYLVLHSRIPQESLHHILHKNGRLISDLLALADRSSEAAAELLHPIPASVATLALENILFLIDVNGFRRSESNIMQRSTDICEELGLSVARMQESSASSLPWLSILLSCCSGSQSLQEPLVAYQSMIDGPQSVRDIFCEEMRYVRGGLNLYSTCVALQDHIFPNREASMIGDASSIGPIVGFLQGNISLLAHIITNYSSADSSPLSVQDMELTWTVGKCIACLELSTNFAAFRECDVLTTIGNLIAVFASVSIAVLPETLKVILEKCLGLVATSITGSRRGFVNPMESGVSCLYQQYFSTICVQLFRGSFQDTRMLWFSAVDVITAAINAEPAYLSTFLASEYASALSIKLRVDSSVKVATGTFQLSFYRTPDGFVLFAPLLKLVLALAITNEGIQYAVDSKIVPQFLTAITYSCYLLPVSQGIPPEVLRKCGRYLGQIIREIPSLKRSIYDGARGSLLYSCYEAIRASEEVSMDTEPSYASHRLQALQKLTNISTLIENLGTAEGRRTSSDFLRDVLKEDVVDALFRAYSCTLPLPQQLTAQLSLVQTGSLVHFGNYSAAKSITSLLKLGIGFAHHVIIGTAFKCIETVLNTLSNEKRILRGLMVVDCSSHDSDNGNNDPYNEALGLRKRRGRGSSQGQQANTNVLILGVLDCFPNSTDAYEKLKEAMKEVSPELERNIWIFITALMELEWFSLILGQCLRIPQRQAGPSLIPIYRDTVRRIYAFYRSSMLEVCRLNSSNWTAKPFNASRSKRGFLDILDLTSKDNQSADVPDRREFVLRVVSPSGALIREDIDISSSRVVYLAPVGSIIKSYQRKTTPDGSIRYNTALGWLSENRRDKEKAPLIELLDIISFPGGYKVESSEAQFMTMRQSTAYAMGRIHVALKQVAVYLSRSMITESPTTRSATRTFALADGATVISSSLSRIAKGLCDSAFESMDEAATPKSLNMFRDNSSSNIADSTDNQGQKSFEKKMNKSLAKLRKSPLKINDDDEDEAAAAVESVSVDAASICLYQGAVMKYIISPIIDDNSNSINMYLLEKFLSDLVIDSIIESFAFILAVLNDALLACEDSAVLSVDGRCALGVIPAFISFFRKITVRDTLLRSPLISLLDSKENDFFNRLYSSLGTKIIPIVRSPLMSELPSDTQKDWLGICGSLLGSLRAFSPSISEKPSSMSADRPLDIRPRRSDGFITSPAVVHSLTLMGFEQPAIVEASVALRSNSMDEIMDRINQFQLRTINEGATPNAPEQQSSGLVVSTATATTRIRPEQVGSPVPLGGEDLAEQQPPETPTPKSAPKLTFNTESHLTNLADVLERRAVEHILRICDGVNKIVRWRAEEELDVTAPIAPFVANFVSLLKTSRNSFKIAPILNHIMLRVFSADESSDNISLHPLLHLLLLLMRNAAKDYAELDSAFYTRVYDGVVRLFRFSSGHDLPSWVSPGLLVLHELCLTVTQKSTSAIDEVVEEDSRYAVTEGAQEKDAQHVAISPTSFLASDGPPPQASIQTIVQNEIDALYVLNIQQREKLLGIVLVLLKAEKENSIGADICQSLLILLASLLSSCPLSFDFVIRDGWKHLLALPQSCEFRDHSNMLSIIARRCFETHAELKLCMSHQVKSLLKSVTKENSMSAETFLQLSKDLFTRNADIFFEVIASCVKFTRKPSGAIVVEAVEEEKVHSSQDGKILDDQVHITLSALMTHATAEHEEYHLFENADAMEVLADCALSLKGLPTLIAKYNCTKDHEFCSIPTFLFRNVFIRDSQSEHLKAGFRLLCVLCSHRGTSRRCVLDAIIDSLQHCIPETHSADVAVLRRLRHIGILISYLVRTSRVSKDTKNVMQLQANSNQNNVCVDVIQHLISANISQLITDALSNLSMSSKEASQVFEALIEPLETISRPQLLNHLKSLHLKLRDSSAVSATAATDARESQNNRVEHETKDDIFDNSSMTTPAQSLEQFVLGRNPSTLELLQNIIEPRGILPMAAPIYDHSEGDHEEEHFDGDGIEVMDNEDSDEDDDDDDEDHSGDEDNDEEEGDDDFEDVEEGDDDDDDDDEEGYADMPDLPDSEDDEDDEEDEDMLIPSDFVNPLQSGDSFLEGRNEMDMNLEDFFDNLLPPRRGGGGGGGGVRITRVVGEISIDANATRLEQSLAEMLGPSAAGGAREIRELLREGRGGANNESIAMNIFRLVEGRRPQNVPARPDGRDAFSFRSYTPNLRDDGTMNDTYGTRNGQSNAALFGSVDAVLQVRRQPSRHPLLDFAEEDRSRGRAPPTDSAASSLREPRAGPQWLVAPPVGQSFLTPGEEQELFPPLARQPTTIGLALEPPITAISHDTGLRLSGSGSSILSGAVSDVIMQTLVADEVVVEEPMPALVASEESSPESSRSIHDNMMEPSMSSTDDMMSSFHEGTAAVSDFEINLFPENLTIISDSGGTSLVATVDSTFVPTVDSGTISTLSDFVPSVAVDELRPSSTVAESVQATEQVSTDASLSGATSEPAGVVPAIEELTVPVIDASPDDIQLDFGSQEEDEIPSMIGSNEDNDEDEEVGETEEVLAPVLEGEVAANGSGNVTMADGPVEEEGQSEERLHCPEGYEPEVFYSLPVELQMEIIQQHGETSDQTRQLVEAAGIDMETFNALPESIRQEILDQARRDLEASRQVEAVPGAGTAVSENATFLGSLSAELRAEVLLTADADFLSTLPPDMQAEAQAQREQAAARWQQREMIGGAELDEGDEEEVEEGDRPGVARRGGAAGESRRADAKLDGKMILPTDDVENTFVPNRLIAVFSCALLKLDFPISLTLCRVLLNMSKNPQQRDLMLRVFVSLLVKDAATAEKAFGDSPHPPLLNAMAATTEDTSNGQTSVDRPTIRFSSVSHASTDSIKRTKRILYVLRQLAASNASVVYDLLRARTDMFGPPSTTQLSQGSPVTSASIMRGESSSHSLLDRVISFFHTEICENGADLLELVSFVDLLCSPLDNVPQQPVAESTTTLENTNPTTTSSAAASPAGSVDVPSIYLSSSSLHVLCELMSNEFCTKKAFKHVMSIISRLAKMKENREVMIAFVLEVIVQLASQSQERLDVLRLTLTKVQKKRVDAMLVAGTDTTTEAAAENKAQSLNSLSLGEVGTRQHECFLQSLSMLLALVNLNGKKLSQLHIIENMGSIWESLDNVLAELQKYAASSNDDVVNARRPQTILNSVLTRLLPVIEAFFLLHSHDLIEDEKNEPDPTLPAAEETSADQTATPTSTGLHLARMNSMPGSAYRHTPEFRRLNITVSLESLEEKGVPVARTRSMRTGSFVGGSSSHISFQRLLSFVQAHETVLNLLIRSHPQLLEGSMSGFIRITPLRSHLVFDNKRAFFFNQLQKKFNTGRNRRGIHIQVRRDQIFEDSFHQLRDRSKEDLRGRLQVSFHGEEGVDAGGLTREWYLTLSREIFNPNYALFSPVDAATFQPNPLSMINSNHLDYFKFVGRVIGKAIADSHLMDAHFTRSFYKHVLGAPVDYNDLEALEPDYYNSLKQIMELPLDMLGLDLTFSAETQTFGKQQVIDLIPGGRNIPVTDENKMEYIQLVAHHRMTTGIRSQIDSFLRGFYELVPPELISIFSPTELELLICGLPDVDIEELKMFTEYHQYRVTDSCITWFWEVLKDFDREERALFLLFVTGTSKVPLGGFSNLQGMRGTQRFSIHKAYGDTSKLPTAHTCFNQLDLPAYESKEELKEKLVLAIKEGSEGFGFA